MRSTSFDKSSVIQLESFLSFRTNLLSDRMKNGQQPSNEEIRSLIERAETKYNNHWNNERENNRRGNQGYVNVETRSPLPDKMKQFKDKHGTIPDHALPGALDMVAETLRRRRTSNFNAYDESGFDIALRKSPEATKSLLSNGLNYLVKYPIMAGLGGIAFGVTVGAIATEGASRLSLLFVSGLAYGALNIFERLESKSLSRKILENNEFVIQGAQKLIGKFIYSSIKNPFFYTSNAVNAFTSYLSGDANNNETNQKKPRTPATTRSISSVEISVSSSYYNAHASGDKKRLQAAQEARFRVHLKAQETRAAPQQNAQNLRPQRASSFPSRSPSEIRKSLLGPDGRLQRASTMQSSPLSRIDSQQPLRNGGVSNRRPGPAPGRPPTAGQASSRRTGNGAPPPPRHR